ncbi:hypothetical protein E2542_SST28469 [Spatholobus suberectus]|nr:hypothetical protein E2542_SST28469 [Spatholobus suberectus]
MTKPLSWRRVGVKYLLRCRVIAAARCLGEEAPRVGDGDWPIFQYGVGPTEKVPYLECVFWGVAIGSTMKTVPNEGTSRFAALHALSPGLDLGVVAYFTSLCVIQCTFNDCHDIQSLLCGFCIAINERDISIDDRFHNELHVILSRRINVILPCAFVGGIYVNCAGDVRQLHESRRVATPHQTTLKVQSECLLRLLRGFRFLVCNECNESHKVSNSYCQQGLLVML